MTAVEFDRVSIVFGDAPERALPLMDQGQTRAEVQTRTGQVLGVHDCSLTVGEGEILVLMGLSGSGKSTLLRGVNALNPVVRGEVRVSDGSKMVSVTKADPETLRKLRLSRVAMVFQWLRAARQDKARKGIAGNDNAVLKQIEASGVTECIKLAEELRGDKVTQIRRLPYPAMPRLTNHVQPTGDVTPAFCYRPEQCAGNTSCRQRRSCTD